MLKTLSLVVILATGGLFGINRLERALLYPFDKTRIAPQDLGLDLREQVFDSGGQQLILWVGAAQPGKPMIVYFHGNAGNLAARAGRFSRFSERGYGVVAMAYRGSSGSTGTPNEQALSFDAARLLSRISDFGDAPLAIYGESLGAAVALAAIERSGISPDGLVLEAPFTTIRDVAQHSLPQMAPSLEPLIKRMRSTWDSLSRIGNTHAPLLILHGTYDALIPIEMGRQLFAAAPSGRKELFVIEGAHHTDLWRSDVLPTLWRFFDTLD